MAGGIPKPDGQLTKLFKSTVPYDVLIAVCGVVPAIMAAIKSHEDGHNWSAFFYGAAAVALLATAVAKNVVQWYVREQKESPHDLEGFLEALHAILFADNDEKSSLRLRLTIHVPAGNELLQILDYVGDATSRGKGRKFSIHCGIIGKAYREGTIYQASRQNDNSQDYIKELTSYWGYTLEDARKVDSSAMAWLAVPLKNGSTNQVAGIVYVDASDKDFFTEMRKDLVTFACAGVARYVARKYN